MSVSAQARPAVGGGGGSFGRFLVLLAVIGTIIGAILLGTHATAKHREAQAIRDCLAREGPAQTWASDASPDIHAFCVEFRKPPCSKWGILIAQVWPSVLDRCDYRERTAFSPGDGSKADMESYLSKSFTRID